VEFHGLINDFTPASAPVNGPWEVRGPWSLTVNSRSSKAEFSAALTMERSDLGVVQNASPSTPAPNPLDNPMLRMAHTHHITMIGDVTPITDGFQVTGYATITKDGAFPPPFGATLPLVTITITGVPPTRSDESNVAVSNITVLFASPADMHFGKNALHGVVRGWDTAVADRQR
jgi:hypothetical protein